MDSAARCRAAGRRHRCGTAARADWPPFDDPNWRSLRDIIAFVSRHFGSVRTAETKLYVALVSRDLLSIRERADGVREPLTCWKRIKFSVVASIHNPGELDSDDDITIVLGDDDEWLSPYSIFGWWPDVERLCGLTVAQPEPVSKSKTVASTAEPPMSPKEWLAWAIQKYPGQPKERHIDYARRLHGLMEESFRNGGVTEVWPEGTLNRRLYD